MKRWQIAVMAVLALALTISTPLAALAQENEPPTEPARPALKGALAVVAPWVGLVGKELTLTVFLRENQEPFPGAGVWALTKEEAEALKKEASQTDGEKDYEAILEGHGIFLGRTGGNGKIAYTFKQAGRFILIAAKKGYRPGYTHIGIREAVDALAIEAPRRVPVGDKVKLTVLDRLTRDPVEDAGVWAVTREKVEALKEQARSLKENTTIPAAEKDYEALVKPHGLFLGRTDKQGRLDYSFPQAGGYLLVAVKKGYIPGFAPLAVQGVPKALGIKSTPPQSHVGKEVNLQVFQRQSNDPVEGAGVWAISRDKAEELKKQAAELREDKSVAAEEKDYETLVKPHGTFLGRTDGKGKLSATFNQAGGYLLVAVKKGYIPGFTVLGVRDLPQPQATTPAAK